MKNLEKPIQIGNTTVKNRLTMPPMATGKAQENGEVSEDIIAYYDDKTKSGDIGLVITEHSFVSPEGRASAAQMSMAEDKDVEGLKKLTEAIHKNGSKVIAQISHAGGAASSEDIGHTPLAPSAVKHPKVFKDTEVPVEMTVEDIQKVIEDFAEAARRAQEAGFDGVEIHSAHGYLLNQFFSPLTNKREDTYNGNTLEGRTKIHLDIIEKIREKVGDDYPVALRLGASDFDENGVTLEDSIAAAKLFEQAGIDLLDISGGFTGFFNPTSKEPGYFKSLSKPIKENIDIPVILTGGVTDGKQAEALLEEEAADLIGVGRALLKDSSWPEQAFISIEE